MITYCKAQTLLILSSSTLDFQLLISGVSKIINGKLSSSSLFARAHEEITATLADWPDSSSHSHGGMLAGRARDLPLEAARVFAELERVGETAGGMGVGALSEEEEAVDEDSCDALLSALTPAACACFCNPTSVVGCSLLPVSVRFSIRPCVCVSAVGSLSVFFCFFCGGCAAALVF